MFYPILTVLVLVTSSVLTNSARILAVVPGPAKSHHIILQAVLRTLAEAGHHVTVYGVRPLVNPPTRYTDVSLGSSERVEYTASKSWTCLENIFSRHKKLMERTLDNENIQKLWTSNETFDLIIGEPYHGQEFVMMFAHRFSAPIIGVHTYVANSLVNLHTGNVFSVNHIPQTCYPYTEHMDIRQRFVNALALIGGIYTYYNYHLPNVERKMREYFPDMPPLLEIVSNVSLMFVNEHATVDYAQPRPPSIIPIAGIHIDSVKPLPQDLKSFVDDSPSGVILMSLGSVIPDETKPETFFASFASAFSKLPQRVIWKTGKDTIPNLPDNVLLVEWMPQRDLLAHPNCVLFITHGGAASYHETIQAGVPVVGIPHFADQHRNVAAYVARGVGVQVLPEEVSEEVVTAAVRTVLGDPRYRENMQRLSRLFKDTMTSPQQDVVYWTDYVLRHQGAPHLKPAVMLLPWYQRLLVEAAVVVLTCLVTAVVLLYIVARLILHCLFVVRVKPKTNKKTD